MSQSQYPVAPIRLPDHFCDRQREDEDNPAQVDGNVSITLHGSRANVYTLDKFGEVTSDHAVTIILDDTDELSGAVRGDSKLDQHLYNYEKNTPPRTGNGASVIVKGDYTSTGIHGFPEVVMRTAASCASISPPARRCLTAWRLSPFKRAARWTCCKATRFPETSLVQAH